MKVHMVANVANRLPHFCVFGKAKDHDSKMENELFSSLKAGGIGNAVFAGFREDVPEVCGIAERRFAGRWRRESSHATENHIPCMAKVPRIAHGTVTFYAIHTCLWDGSEKFVKNLLCECHGIVMPTSPHGPVPKRKRRPVGIPKISCYPTFPVSRFTIGKDPGSLVADKTAPSKNFRSRRNGITPM